MVPSRSGSPTLHWKLGVARVPAKGPHSKALVHGSEPRTVSPFPLRRLRHTVAIGPPKAGHCVEDLAGEANLDPLAPEGSAPHALTQDALVSEYGVLYRAPLATETSPAELITEIAFSSGPVWVNFHHLWIPETPARLAIKNRFETFEKASSLPIPWLLFHGRQDTITPFTPAEVLAGTNADPRCLVPLESGHEDVIDVGRDQMKSALKDFLRDLFGLDHAA